jgi:putative oxidoreductase
VAATDGETISPARTAARAMARYVMSTTIAVMMTAWTPRLLSVLRIVAALLYFMHGTSKLLALPPVRGGATVPLFSLTGAAGVVEIGGGLLILIGLFTRPAAFVCSGEMASAYFISHARRALFPLQNMGELPILFCFVFLYLAAAGGGPWSVDAARRNRA